MEVHSNPAYRSTYYPDHSNVAPAHLNNYFHQRHSSISDPELTKIEENCNKNRPDEQHYSSNNSEIYYKSNLRHTASECMDSKFGLEDNTYYNPHYVCRTSSSGSSMSSAVDHVQPHYYEIQPNDGPTLLPLNLVDKEVHSRRVSALLSVQNKKLMPAPKPPIPNDNRRYSLTPEKTTHHHGLFRKHSEDTSTREKGFTFGKKSASRLIKTKFNPFTALGSELSNSASALYNLFTNDKSDSTEEQVNKRRKDWNDGLRSTDDIPSSPVAKVTDEPKFLAGSHLNDSSTISVGMAKMRRQNSDNASLNNNDLKDDDFDDNIYQDPSVRSAANFDSNGSIYSSLNGSIYGTNGNVYGTNGSTFSATGPIYGTNGPEVVYRLGHEVIRSNPQDIYAYKHQNAQSHYAVSTTCHYYDTGDQNGMKFNQQHNNIDRNNSKSDQNQANFNQKHQEFDRNNLGFTPKHAEFTLESDGSKNSMIDPSESVTPQPSDDLTPRPEQLKHSENGDDEETDEAIGSSSSQSLPSTGSSTVSSAILPPTYKTNVVKEFVSVERAGAFPEINGGHVNADVNAQRDRRYAMNHGDEIYAEGGCATQSRRHFDALRAVKDAHLQPPNYIPVTKTSIAMVHQHINDITDQTNQVSDHTQRGIEFLDKYGQFVKERAQIEDEYALKLRNLAKKCSTKKKEEDEYKAFSYFNTFNAILKELGSLAAQHETISEKLKNQICPVVATKCNELRMGRKRHLQELQNLNNQLTAQVDHMNKMKKNYLKAFKEAETAYIKHDKADKNMEISRAELERTKANLAQKTHASNDARCRYYEILQQTNAAQKGHYEHQIPQLLERMRQLDMDRINATKSAMVQTVDVETGVLKVVQRCYDDMRSAISVIDPEKDTHVVVELKKTGYAHPPDFAFQDLGDPARILDNNGESTADAFMANNATLKRGQVQNGKAVSRKGSMHHRIFGGSGNNSGKSTVQSEYGHLPPQQRCRKLEHKIAELDADISKREHSKAGLQKMLTVYTENPKLGNAADVDQQINEFQSEINHLVDQRSRYAKLLMDAQAELNLPSNGSIGSSSPRVQSISSLNGSNGFIGKRASYSEDSISSDGSAIMGMPKRNGGLGSSAQGSTNGSTLNSTNGAPGLNSTVNSSLAYIPHIDSAAETASNSNESTKPVSISESPEIYEETDAVEHLPILGTCKALYVFESAGGDGTTISMQAGDELYLLEKDDGQGDGWTRVRHSKTLLEGFVPTSYLECHWN
ncbi:unnamed protein product [Bursaphelenchus okinawaensis]|uniref:SH3 domain-containing protein n=1 Tax=Bursaphelenchus okinawaensis TaxID=465554 RepID=A0A811LNR4_9BILA|nr:unnamed protein product [Bursaphelenchus okinawaensis]CAG9127327.1 unnamed protein product [Bursaphelenchus okinawaensis]